MPHGVYSVKSSRCSLEDLVLFQTKGMIEGTYSTLKCHLGEERQHAGGMHLALSPLSVASRALSDSKSIPKQIC